MTDEARLQRWLASHRTATPSGPSSDHIDMDTLSLHAAGQLHGLKLRMVTEHLIACDDGRCPAFVTAQAGENAAPAAPVARAGSTARARTFQAREVVWTTFESMALEGGVSIDELVCDAMDTYSQARGYARTEKTRLPSSPEHDPVSSSAAYSAGALPTPRIADKPLPDVETEPRPPVSVSPLDRSYLAGGPPPDVSDEDLARTSNRGKFSRPGASPAAAASAKPGPDSRTTPRGAFKPEASSSEVPTRRPPPLQGGPSLGPVGKRRRTKSSTTAAMHLPPSREPAAKQLILTHQGRSVTVDKDRFLLGRSKTQADLRIDDPNVSRQHAVIERVGAAWFLVDLGSTNGVHVSGERVARRALADGDVILVISHQIRCSVR